MISRREVLIAACAFITAYSAQRILKAKKAKEPSMKIVIETVPHTEQRYNTPGDWTIEDDSTHSQQLSIKVSEMEDWRYEALIAVHELCEALLCRQAGVRPEQIDEFDFNFKGEGEPGDDPNAPYFPQHKVATQIEIQLAQYLGVEWSSYSREVDKLAALYPPPR